MDVITPEMIGVRSITQDEYNEIRALGTATTSVFGFLSAEIVGSSKKSVRTTYGRKIDDQYTHRAFFDLGDFWYETIIPMTPYDFHLSRPWMLLKQDDPRRAAYLKTRVTKKAS